MWGLVENRRDGECRPENGKRDPASVRWFLPQDARDKSIKTHSLRSAAAISGEPRTRGSIRSGDARQTRCRNVGMSFGINEEHSQQVLGGRNRVKLSIREGLIV